MPRAHCPRDLSAQHLHLVLATGGGAGGGGSLEELDLGCRCILELLQAVHGLLVCGLELLEESLVLGLGGGKLGLECLEHGSARGGVHGGVLLQLFLLRIGAVLESINGAARSELVGGEFLEIVKGATSLVVLAILVGWVEVFDRGVSTDTLLFAERLAGRGTVNISDDDSF